MRFLQRLLNYILITVKKRYGFSQDIELAIKREKLMINFINKYFGNFNTKLTQKRVKNTLKFLENFSGNRSKIRQCIKQNTKERKISKQVLTGNTQHMEAVSSYFKSVPYDSKRNQLFYYGPIILPENLYFDGYMEFARDLVKGIIILLTGESPEIYLETFSLPGMRETPYQISSCDFHTNSTIPALKEKSNIGSRIYINAIKDVFLARVLIELKEKTWTSFNRILEIIVEDVRKLCSIEDKEKIKIILDDGKVQYVQGTDRFFSGRSAASDLNEGLSHVGRSGGSVSDKRFDLNEALNYIRKVISVWIKYKHAINILDFLLFDKEIGVKKTCWSNELVQSYNSFLLEAIILGNSEDLESLEKIFYSMCAYDSKDQKVFYKAKFTQFSFLEQTNPKDFFNEERELLKGIVRLLTNHLRLVHIEFCFTDFLFRNQEEVVVVEDNANQKCNIDTRSSMGIIEHVCSAGTEVYKIMRKSDELLKIIKLFARGWSWENFFNICEILQKRKDAINQENINWINRRANNSTILYDGGRHIKFGQDLEDDPFELRKAAEIVQEETINWIKLEFGLTVQKSKSAAKVLALEEA